MMRPVRDDALAELENAALRRGALGALDAGTGFPWLRELDRSVARRVATARRMEARLFERAVLDGGDPAGLAEDLRRFLSLNAEMRGHVANWAGLAYHIASFGPAVTRDTIMELTAVFGKEAVTFALANSHLAAAVSPAPQQDGDRLRALVETDGWAILKLWATSRGLAPIWQAGWGSGCEGGSVSLHRRVAEAIATAVVARLDEIRAFCRAEP